MASQAARGVVSFVFRWGAAGLAGAAALEMVSLRSTASGRQGKAPCGRAARDLDRLGSAGASRLSMTVFGGVGQASTGCVRLEIVGCDPIWCGRRGCARREL